MLIQQTLLTLLDIYVWVLIVRIVLESIGNLARSFRPPRWLCVVGEPFFLATDPPLNLLRRVIPPLKMGGMALDIAVLVLFFALMLLRLVIQVLF